QQADHRDQYCHTRKHLLSLLFLARIIPPPSSEQEGGGKSIRSIDAHQAVGDAVPALVPRVQRPRKHSLGVADRIAELQFGGSSKADLTRLNKRALVVSVEAHPIGVHVGTSRRCRVTLVGREARTARGRGPLDVSERHRCPQGEGGKG